MDYFGATNPYYVDAHPIPSTEPPTFDLQHREFRQTYNKPNWKYLNPIGYVLKQNECPSFKIMDKVINQKSSNIFEAYTTPQHVQEYNKLNCLKEFRKQTKISLKDRISFSQIQMDIVQSLEDKFELDFSAQRGHNPFIHKRDYCMPIEVMGQFSSFSNLKKIAQQIEYHHLPTKIIIHPINLRILSQDKFNGQFNNVEIDNKYHNTVYKDIQGTEVQIMYLKIDQNQDVYVQLLNWTTMLSYLSDGGVFVIQTENVLEASLVQFIYLYTHLFSTVALQTTELLDCVISIGCFGFQRKLANQFIKVIINQYDELMQTHKDLFPNRDITQNINFEKYIIKFYKELLLRRTAQILLMQLLSEGQQIKDIQDFQQSCEILKKDFETEMEQKEQNNKNRQNYYNNNRNYNNNNSYNNHEGSHRPPQQKIMNPVPQIQEIEFKMDYDIDPMLQFKLNQKKPAPTKVVVTQKEQEQLKLQALINSQTKKTKPKKQATK